jgi:HD-like signal output (HDOD) protein
MEVAQNPKSSASDLALVVSSDPGLSGRLLRVVNSAAYRRSREITSVQEALVTLGFVQARNMAISGAIAGAYAPDALNALFRIEVFWRHAIAVASRLRNWPARAAGWMSPAPSPPASCTTWAASPCTTRTQPASTRPSPMQWPAA